MDFGDVRKRLEAKQIDTTFEQGRGLGLEHLLRFGVGRWTVRLDAQPERANRNGDRNTISSGFTREACRDSVDFVETAESPYCWSLCAVAPKVLVSMMSAPARMYSEWISRTRSGLLRFN